MFLHHCGRSQARYLFTNSLDCTDMDKGKKYDPKIKIWDCNLKKSIY